MSMAAKYQLPEWESMTPRQRDAAVAEFVFEWKWLRDIAVSRYPDEDREVMFERLVSSARELHADDRAGGSTLAIPHYTSDANADQSVLRLVRETWDQRDSWGFRDILRRVWNERNNLAKQRGDQCREWELRYEVGDYAMAAYECVRQRHQQGGTE